MCRKASIALIALLAIIVLPTRAQQADTTDFHGQINTGVVIASGLGSPYALGWVAPSVEYNINPRLQLHGGFTLAEGLLPTNYELPRLETARVSMKQHGTRVGMAWAGADYQVNDRLRLWGDVMMWHGMAENWWMNGSQPVEGTAFHGGLSYRLSNESLLEMHIHLVHDLYDNSMLGFSRYPFL